MRRAIAAAVLMFSIIFLPIIQATDSDGDGVQDVDDICQFIAGNATSALGLGCPDSDGNGLADFEEEKRHNWGNSVQENIDYNDPVGGEPESLEWALNGSVFYGGGQTDTVVVFDSLGNRITDLYTMTGDIRDIELSPDGTMLAVTSKGDGAVVINSTTGNLIVNLRNNSNGSLQGWIWAVGWSNDQNHIFVHNGSSGLLVFETANWSMIQFITGFPEWFGSSWIGGIDTTPDDSMLVFSTLAQVHGYWTSNWTKAWTNQNNTEYVRALEISPDGRFMLSGGDAGVILVHDITTARPTLTNTINITGFPDIYEIEVSDGGGTAIIASRSESYGITAFDTTSWSSLGAISGFGDNNGNRGVDTISLSPDGERLAVSHRRGWLSVSIVPDGFLRVHGDYYNSLMEGPWRSTFVSNELTPRTWEYDRVSTTLDICASNHYMSSYTNGISPLYAIKDVDYEENGLWDCKNSNETILEIPYGRAAGALMVKSGGETEACLQTIGGLSMGQLRWLTSSQTKSSLTANGEMPGLVWSSVVPNDNGNSIPEWIDLHSSCPDTEIVLSHRWSNKTDITILEETVLCANCAQTDSLYTSTAQRYRAIVGEFRSDITQGLNASAGEGSIGFTELVYSLNYSNELHIVPIVDNYTHGAADAINAGGVAINPSLNSSRSGEWPLQTDMRVATSLEHLSRNINFIKYLLTDTAQLKWEQMGFTGLDAFALYKSWARLGIDMSHLLPDGDGDGVWDGEDLCPDTDQLVSVDDFGCAENQLDNDNDGYTNDQDDCDDEFGTSIWGSIGCPDSDGDGWQDVDDSHPDDVTEWNDTDEDGFGDNSDDCIDLFGNSTEDVIGCLDTDGDGWSDLGDVFPQDPTEWLDSDLDNYGNNIDAFPFEHTQWADTDLDGFGDNETGLEGDDCIDEYGMSFQDGIFGCLDSDGDGWADVVDDLPLNPEQYRDLDGDGVGDDATLGSYDWCPETSPTEISLVDSNGCGPSERDTDYDSFTDDIDQCLNTPITQTSRVNTTIFLDAGSSEINPFLGCAPSEIDEDGDLVTLDNDWDDKNPDQIMDTDGDGFGDNSDGANGDDCPFQNGNSVYDLVGCVDLDGDGWSSSHDFNDGDNTQWNDTDGDGFGDNWDNPDWNETRQLGIFFIGATEPDRCPNQYSGFLYSQFQGCLDKLVDGDDDSQESTETTSEEEESNLILILGIAATGIIFILFGAIAVILRKKPKNRQSKPRARSSVNSETEDLVNQAEEVLKESESVSNPDFVANWEDLPAGEWLPNDEDGVNWYLDNDGRHWYSDDDGFRIWRE